jgi:hypothetical protein
MSNNFVDFHSVVIIHRIASLLAASCVVVTGEAKGFGEDGPPSQRNAAGFLHSRDSVKVFGAREEKWSRRFGVKSESTLE